MTCRICGGQMEPRISDLPFKLGDTAIVIVKGLPIAQCGQCNGIELNQGVMVRVEEMLKSVDDAVELEILRYAG